MRLPANSPRLAPTAGCPTAGRRSRRRAFVLVSLLLALVLLPASSCAGAPPAQETWRVVADEVIVKFLPGVDRPEIDGLIARCDAAVKVDGNAALDASAASDTPDGDALDDLEELTRNLFWLELTGGQSVDGAIACFLAQPDLVESAEPNILSEPAPLRRDPMTRTPHGAEALAT